MDYSRCVTDFLESNNIVVRSQRRLPTNLGSQLLLYDGEVVNVFDSGTIHVQGTGNLEAIENLLSKIDSNEGGGYRLARTRRRLAPTAA